MSGEEARLALKQAQACHPSGNLGGKQESNRFSIPFKSQEPVNSTIAKSLCICIDYFQGTQRDPLLCTWEFQGVCEGSSAVLVDLEHFVGRQVSSFSLPWGLEEAALLGLQCPHPEFHLPVD